MGITLHSGNGQEDTFYTAWSHTHPNEAIVRKYEDAYREFHGHNIMQGNKREQDAWLSTLVWVAQQEKTGIAVTLQSIRAAHSGFLRG